MSHLANSDINCCCCCCCCFVARSTPLLTPPLPPPPTTNRRRSTTVHARTHNQTNNSTQTTDCVNTPSPLFSNDSPHLIPRGHFSTAALSFSFIKKRRNERKKMSVACSRVLRGGELEATLENRLLQLLPPFPVLRAVVYLFSSCAFQLNSSFLILPSHTRSIYITAPI